MAYGYNSGLLPARPVRIHGRVYMPDVQPGMLVHYSMSHESIEQLKQIVGSYHDGSLDDDMAKQILRLPATADVADITNCLDKLVAAAANPPSSSIVVKLGYNLDEWVASLHNHPISVAIQNLEIIKAPGKNFVVRQGEKYRIHVTENGNSGPDTAMPFWERGGAGPEDTLAAEVMSTTNIHPDGGLVYLASPERDKLFTANMVDVIRLKTLTQ
ncbi:MAG: hypothetical protein QS98_C0013G0016 [archaeon GW2011_AR3]|nr:MAG: hypothetical protein QS98_C0013G0016 [archaeon GW2011_AR3]MBS3108961.1 hypothetical protein [Candidatus Woesearchaeota archaeon]